MIPGRKFVKKICILSEVFCPKWMDPTYWGPLRPDLPLTADLELAGAGCVRLLQVLAAVLLHCQCAVGIDLPAQDLPVLHSQPTGFAALRPLPYIPAEVEKKRISLFYKQFSNTNLNRTTGMTRFWCWSRILQNCTSVSVCATIPYKASPHTCLHSPPAETVIMSTDTDCTIHGLKIYHKSYRICLKYILLL